MTTQENAAKMWSEGARDAFDTAQQLVKSSKNHHALFFCHLAIEKALKAQYIVKHNEIPPYTHDLILLASKVSADFNKDQIAEFAEVNTFNIAARYQEEKLGLYEKATEQYTTEWINRTNLILQSLLP